MDLSNFEFTLYDSTLDDGRVKTLMISIDFDTGETTIPSKSEDGSSDYIVMDVGDVNLMEHNTTNYLEARELLMKYLQNYNPQVMANSKVDLRISHLSQVIGYYYDWFIINNYELPVYLENSTTAQDNRSVTVDGVAVTLNKRQYNVLVVLKNRTNPISTINLLIEVDKLCNTVTSYTRVSEIFKGKRNVFRAFIDSPQKGYYKLKEDI